MVFFREVVSGTTPKGIDAARQPSVALQEMANRLAGFDRPNLLDLGSPCGGNVVFFAALGCKVFVEAAEDLRRLSPLSTAEPSVSKAVSPLASLGSSSSGSRIELASGPRTGGAGEQAPLEAQEDPRGSGISLTYPDRHFNGILLWDVMDYLGDDPARELGRELLRVSRAEAFLSLYSDSRRHQGPQPLFRYKIGEDGTIGLEEAPGGSYRRIFRENRHLYALFSGFQVVRSMLLRNQIREILMQQIA